MSGTTRRLFSAGAVALCVGLVALGSVAQAAPINYGDFNVPSPPSSVDFLDVTESSNTDSVPLYGAPDPFAVGLDFDPKAAFSAFAQNGSTDFTDGQLNFTVMGNTFPPAGVIAIDTIKLSERGDYTLLGSGGAATYVLAGAILSATVTEIDGAPALGGPIDLGPVNGSVAFNLAANQGITQPWSLGLTLDVAGQLASMGVPFIVGATKVEVFVDNGLYAQSEAGQPGTTAFIAKKDFRITIEDHPGQVPEPATAGLVLFALAGLSAARKRS